MIIVTKLIFIVNHIYLVNLRYVLTDWRVVESDNSEYCDEHSYHPEVCDKGESLRPWNEAKTS